MNNENVRPVEPGRVSYAHNEAPQLPATGFLRLSNIIGRRATATQSALPALVPVSASTLWGWVRADKFPKPCRLPGHVTAWKVEAVREWLHAQGGDA